MQLLIPFFGTAKDAMHKAQPIVKRLVARCPDKPRARSSLPLVAYDFITLKGQEKQLNALPKAFKACQSLLKGCITKRDCLEWQRQCTVNCDLCYSTTFLCFFKTPNLLCASHEKHHSEILLRRQREISVFAVSITIPNTR